MHNACDTPIERYLQFVQWRHICNERKERDPICLYTNENAQLQSAGVIGDMIGDFIGEPDELRTSRGSRLVVKLPPVGCVQLSLTCIKAFKNNSNSSGRAISNG